jgi:hypothetical protein
MIFNKIKPNINNNEKNIRGLIGLIFFIITIFILLYNLNPILLFISIFMTLIGFIQYILKFCVLVAFTKKESKNKKTAIMIIFYTLIISLIITYLIIIFF